MLKVELVSYEDLTVDEQMNQPSNGVGKEYANYIRLMHNGGTVAILSDAVEPEDARFTRDFGVVMGAIEKAYQLGVEDGERKR